MGMSPIKFFGSTVIDVDLSLGYGSELSEVTVNLVEDLRNGDSYVSGIIGSPYRLQISGLTFDGILQQQERRHSPQGNPVYSVRLRTPNDFLDGQSLIISDFSGVVGHVPNLMNLYGYWEHVFGFGGSLINEFGMVWEAPNISVTVTTGNITSTTNNGLYGIKKGIENLQDNQAPIFGSGFYYNGHKYLFDLSQIDDIDIDWRFNADGGSTRLIEVIDAVCNDKGYDYYVSLHIQTGTMGPHTIRINTIDRTTAPELGKIEEFLGAAENVVSKNIGQELNFEQTSLFLAGANIESILQQTNRLNIIPFWGFNPNGSVIQGAGFDDNYEVTVPCFEIADIIGTNFYTFKVSELRCALSNQDIWAGYILKYKPSLAAAIEIASCFASNEIGINYRFAHDFVNQSPEAARRFSEMNNNNKWTSIINRVYGFVKNYAEGWYGKRFIVKTPIQLNFKFEPETARLKWDWEPIDAAYLENGANPLGLNAMNQEFFENQEDKMLPIVKYDFWNLTNGPTGADITSYQNPYKLMQNNFFYTTCEFIKEAGIFYVDGQTAVAIQLSDCLYTVAPDTLGGVSDIASLFSVSSRDWADYRHSSTAGKYYPAALQPAAVALPFRSNTQSYGPWYIKGDPARTEYRKEESLAPWNYGGYNYMNIAASGMIENFVRNSKLNEQGFVTIAGFPSKNLGDKLGAYGANITNININLSPQGVTTTYVLRTHTQKPGSFGKLRMERLAREGQRTARLGRKILEIGRATNTNISNIITSNPSYRWLDRVSRAIKQESPHATLVGFVASGIGDYCQALVSSQTYEESVANVSKSGLFRNAACVSMDAIYRPFAISPDYSGLLPKQERKSTQLTDDILSRLEWDYFEGQVDIDWFTFGNTNDYKGLHYRKSAEAEPSKAKIIGMRMPLYGVGWGYDYFAKPVPNEQPHSQTQYKGMFATNHTVKSNLWKSGPVFLHWDQKRKGWGVPTIVRGIVTAEFGIGPESEGDVAVIREGEVKTEVFKAYNFMDVAIPRLTKVIACYNQWENKFDIIVAGCSTSEKDIPTPELDPNYDSGEV